MVDVERRLPRLLGQATRLVDRGNIFSPLVLLCLQRGSHWVQHEYVDSEAFQKFREAVERQEGLQAVADVNDPSAAARASAALKRSAWERAQRQGRLSEVQTDAPAGVGARQRLSVRGEVPLNVPQTADDGGAVPRVPRQSRRGTGVRRGVGEHVAGAGDAGGVRPPGRPSWDVLAREVREGSGVEAGSRRKRAKRGA